MKCKDCEIREFFARAFDVHIDELDCPYECPYIQDDKKVVDERV